MRKLYENKNDSILSPPTLSFESESDYTKYVEKSWSSALKDSKFIKLLEDYIYETMYKFLYDRKYKTHNIEEAGIIFKGDCYGFHINDINTIGECKIDDIMLYMRPKSFEDQNGKTIEFSNPLVINGKNINYGYDDMDMITVDKGIRYDVMDMVDKISKNILEDFSD